MMKDFILPDIGEGIVECELLEWLVSEGEDIVEDQPVAEVMTDKATVQIPAMYSGKVTKLYYQAGEVAQVHQPLFAMELGKQTSVDTQNSNTQKSSEPANVSLPTQLSQTDRLEDFILPDIGEGIVECELVKWLVAEGDQIVEDQPVVEVMTDKALVEIPAKYSGTVAKLYYQQGETAKVHTALFGMRLTDQVVAVSTNQQTYQNDPRQTTTGATKDIAIFDKQNGKALASPAVRRVARELSIDLSAVNGTGKKGRVLKEDLIALSKRPSDSAATANHCETSELFRPQAVLNRKEPIKGIQAAMARQMSLSVSTIPHFTVSEEIEMDKLIEARALLRTEFADASVKLSFMPFFIKALSMAIKSYPILNSQVNDDCTELTYYADHNIGIAVDSKIGLMVPNIKGVQNLSLMQIAKEVNRLVDAARLGRLASDDLKGGTISISNIGVLGGTVSTPVINKPEVAIVALGKTQRLPRFDEHDQVQAVNVMQISWSGDHRVIDGATMVRFNNVWKSYLENPLLMLADLH
jgi:2-oxoisovalerate dehydrogenase E2 component (dihydrolipoyl transacylase)